MTYSGAPVKRCKIIQLQTLCLLRFGLIFFLLLLGHVWRQSCFELLTVTVECQAGASHTFSRTHLDLEDELTCHDREKTIAFSEGVQDFQTTQRRLELVKVTTFSGWWFGTCFVSPYLGTFIIPIDELIFFRRGRLKPPTRFCYWVCALIFLFCIHY